LTAPGPRILRAPNHLGDLVAALPALLEANVDVMVRAELAPLLSLTELEGQVLPLVRDWSGWWDARARLRAGAYRSAALMTPAFSAAWLFRAAGIRHLRGSATDGRSWMLTERIPSTALRGPHRIEQYRLLAGVDTANPTVPAELSLPDERVERWRSELRSVEAPLVGFFPGANAPARRWPADRFAEVVAWAESRGLRCVVLGSGAESIVVKEIVRDTSSAIDLSGKTDLVDLATVLACCDVLVTNDTGPMHLAGIVHTPTVSLWGPSDPGEVRPTGSIDHPVEGPSLPCRPCYRNQCPRTGRGTRLEHAHEECMRIIETQSVIQALDRALGGGATA